MYRKIHNLKWILCTLFLTLSLKAIAEPEPFPSVPPLKAKSYILQDFFSGQILAELNADKRVEPASLTKLMTAYIIYHELKKGSINEEQSVHISEKAWKAEGSRMFIEVGKSVLVKDLIKGIIIQSGNDASIAMAEFVAGSEEAFVELMNEHAKRLGLKHTQFQNSTGLPHAEHYTTARDLSILAHALIRDFPEHYGLYSQKSFTYNNIVQYNRNKLLWQDKSVDGVKTGHTESAGFCLIASALRDGMRLVSVVTGTETDNARIRESQKLLTYGFRYFKTYKLYDARQVLQERKVWLGKYSKVTLGLSEPLYTTIPRGQYDTLSASVVTPPVIKAEVKEGQILGNVNIMLNDEVIVKRPLVALTDIPKGGVWSRFKDHSVLFFKQTLGKIGEEE